MTKTLTLIVVCSWIHETRWKQNKRSPLTFTLGEANLDLQYILGVSAPIPIIEYSTGGLG